MTWLIQWSLDIKQQSINQSIFYIGAVERVRDKSVSQSKGSFVSRHSHRGHSRGSSGYRHHNRSNTDVKKQWGGELHIFTEPPILQQRR